MIEMKFDVEGYCELNGLHDVEVYISGSGMIYLTVNDIYPDGMEYVIGNTGEKAWCVVEGWKKPSTIAEIKKNIKKIALDISKEMCYS